MKPAKGPPTCRSCGVQIRFARMESGKWMPLDRHPSELNGNVLIQRGVGKVMDPLTAARLRDEGYALYVSHFSTCPNARAHRRDRDAREPGVRERENARQAARAAFAKLQRQQPERQGRLL